ncbi:RES family NAD+ phosphorylase [Cereibacter sphaeroides]|uniref:RES family NAD+ phosphorylase n=1 Tax=Cereibacter sphaeroides TaxID=1063 RepID=UPI001F37D8E5|nr:RES family NAD+ phosphorylase [Cereibacter sphaeroides]MCE6957865.1 RES family NAD+ phosphorylase [Cereibacter sphaeroides]MCE6971834.1 RES family NAD+ phosphorylase [Cereibacter sphaeroides]
MPPLPPADIALRTPLVRTMPAGARLHRFHDRAFGPIWFGRAGTGRLDDADHSYGVLYVAEGEDGAFSETFLRRPGRNLIDPAVLARKSYTILSCRRDLVLARLHGRGLGVIGATAEVTHGGLPYDVPQAWSKAQHDHPARFDGILYRSRHDDDELCLALFDRVEPDIGEVERRPDLDEDWFWRTAERYGVGLAP